MRNNLKFILISFLLLIINSTAIAQILPEDFGFEIVNGKIYKNGEEVGWEKEDINLRNIEIEDSLLSKQKAYKEKIYSQIKALVQEKNAQLAALSEKYPEAKDALEKLIKAHSMYAKTAKTLSAHTQDSYPAAIIYLYDSYKYVEKVSAQAAPEAKDIINHLYIYSKTGIADIFTITEHFIKMSKIKDFSSIFTYNYNLYGPNNDIPVEWSFHGPAYFEDLTMWYKSLTRTDEVRELNFKAMEHYRQLSENKSK